MSNPPTPAPAPKSRLGLTIAVLMIFMALGAVVWWNYYLKVKNDATKVRLPIKGKVETDPGYFVDRNNQPKKLEDLLGKVVVWSYVYTTCPQGCLGVAEKMKELQKEFGSNPKFQLVSVCLYPEFDRPERLNEWIKTAEFGGDNWWFLTTKGGAEADGEAMRKWMQKTFGIWAKKKDEEHLKEFPNDVWDHQLVMAVTDVHGNIRTPSDNDSYWWVFHQAFDNSWAPRPIREDIVKLLEEAEGK